MNRDDSEMTVWAAKFIHADSVPLPKGPGGVNMGAIDPMATEDGRIAPNVYETMRFASKDECEAWIKENGLDATPRRLELKRELALPKRKPDRGLSR